MQLIKRTNVLLWQKLVIKIGAIIAAMVLLSLVLLGLGHNPINVFTELFKGALLNPFRIKETINVMIPMTLTALGVLLAFKMKFWNIGAEGQIIVGAIAGSYFALFHSELPAGLLLPIMAIAAMVAGGIWAFIPGYFKVKYNSNETLFTLMMNYLALQVVMFLQYSLWKDPTSFGFAKIAQFTPNAIYPKIFGVHMGWIIMVLMIAAVYMLINHTKLGYEICVVGTSHNTARYAGMDVKGTVLKTIALSGAIAGLVGILQASAIDGTLSTHIGGGYGFTAIIIAWLSSMSALAVPFTAFFFAILTQGAAHIQTAFQIPQALAEIMQGVILLFALGSEFFIEYRISFKVKEAKGGPK